jgi:hypothetical protein
VQNDSDLIAFDTWRAQQPDANDPGLVFAAMDQASKSFSVWWAGPETDFLHRMQAEARTRGIALIVHQAFYTRSEIERAVTLIFEHKLRFRAVGFDLRGAAGPTPDFRSMTVIGVPLSDENAKQLAPDLVAAIREVVAALLRNTVIDPNDIKIESSRSREEWFGDPTPGTNP